MLESKKNRSISRRDLVKVASAGVGTIALGGIGAQPATAAETVPACSGNPERRWVRPPMRRLPSRLSLQ